MDSSDALEWTLSGQNSGAVHFNTGDRQLRWYNSNFQISDSRRTSDLYLYEKHTSPGGQAALTGTLSYTVKTGSTLTEAQIKEAASVVRRTSPALRFSSDSFVVTVTHALSDDTLSCLTSTPGEP